MQFLAFVGAQKIIPQGTLACRVYSFDSLAHCYHPSSHKLEFFFPQVGHRNQNFSAPDSLHKTWKYYFNLPNFCVSQLITEKFSDQLCLISDHKASFQKKSCPPTQEEGMPHRDQDESEQTGLTEFVFSVYYHSLTTVCSITQLHSSLLFIKSIHKNKRAFPESLVLYF